MPIKLRYQNVNSFKFQRLKSLPRKCLFNGKRGCEFIRIAAIEIAAPKVLSLMATKDTYSIPYIVLQMNCILQRLK